MFLVTMTLRHLNKRFQKMFMKEVKETKIK